MEYKGRGKGGMTTEVAIKKSAYASTGYKKPSVSKMNKPEYDIWREREKKKK